MTTFLTHAGLARRAAMRGALVQGVVRRRRLRRATQAAAPLVAIGIAVLLFAPRRPSAGGAPGAEAVPSIAVVRDDPTIVARLAIAPEPTVQWLDDDRFAALLRAEVGPCGVVRIGDRCVVPGVPIDSVP